MNARPSGGSRLSLNSCPPHLGGESFPAAASRMPHSIGGGSGVYSEPPLESPRGSDAPMPVIFISEQEVASTCRGTYAATSRFCIKRIIPGGQHHCGIVSHKKNKFPVKGGTFWAPGGYVKNELVAMCGECVAADAIPTSMLHLFDKDARRSSTEWRNIIIDALHPEPSIDLGSIPSGICGEPDRENEEGDEEIEPRTRATDIDEISLLGSIDVADLAFGDWLKVEPQDEAEVWPKHVKQHQEAMDVLFAKVNHLGLAVGKVASKLNEDVIPIMNVTSYDVRHVQEKQSAMQESIDHMLPIIALLEQRYEVCEAMKKSWEGCVSGLSDVNQDMADLRQEVEDQASALKATEGVIAGLIMKVKQSVVRKTSVLSSRVGALEAKSGWVHVGEGEDGEESLGGISTRRGDRADGYGGGEGMAVWSEAMTRLNTLEAKVNIQLERSKSQGVSFHKVAFSSESEFMQWYLKENTAGKGLSEVSRIGQQGGSGVLALYVDKVPSSVCGESRVGYFYADVQGIREVALVAWRRRWRRCEGASGGFAAYGG
jgi:hypothetical protein